MRRALLTCLLLSCGPPSLTIAMIEQNNSGQDGTATLFDASGGLDVTVNIKQSEQLGSQNSHIHTGRCDDVGPIAFGISKVTDAAAADGGTIVFHQLIANVTLAQLRDGNHVINVHDARDNSLYVSCGEIK